MIHAPVTTNDNSLEKTQFARLQMTTNAWLALYDGVIDFVRRRVSSAMDAEDIVQGCFLRLYQHIETLKDETHVRAWIYATARNAVTDHYRTRARRRFVAAESMAIVAPEPVDRPLQKLAECVPALLGRLSAEDARAILLVDIDGQAQNDAARTFNVSLSGMKSRVQRARRRLRAVIEACCHVRVDANGAIAELTRRNADACACGDPCGC